MSFDDLLGDAPAPRPRGRPRKTPVVDLDDDVTLKTTDLHKVSGGVSVPWLVKVFRMGRGKVEESLRDCPVLRTHKNGGAIYDLPTAASYLVQPKTNLDAYLLTLKPSQLPEQLKGAFWDAKTKEAKFRVMAGDLWPTQAILETLGETFKTMKTTIQLWADTIEETKGLTNEQRALLLEMTDRLLADTHGALVEQAKNNMTESWLKEFASASEEA